MTTIGIRHPYYFRMIDEWKKYRLTYRGGIDFIEKYLQRFSIKESISDFADRKSITYCPAHAKAAINDIKNAIYQRLVDVSRKEGTHSYLQASAGLNGGVDCKGSTMNGFMGTLILPELLVTGVVGIYIDKQQQNKDASLLETNSKTPYLYKYCAEDILSWNHGKQNQLTALLLKDHDYMIDNDTNLIKGKQSYFRLLNLTSKGVKITIFDSDEKIVSITLLDINEIPFVLDYDFISLLTDVADYQIAHLNMASSDVNYSLKSNFPFYTEQFDSSREMANKSFISEAGKIVPETTKEVKTGTTQGRRYPKGIERPGFISPSAAPLLASMEKQQELKKDIRQLVNLGLANAGLSSSSAESKQSDQSGLEAGLSAIGSKLEHIERNITRIWSKYERDISVTVVKYPARYTLRSDVDRRHEAKELQVISNKIPSMTYQKDIAKEITIITLGSKVSEEQISIYCDEIEKAKVALTDHDIVRSDHEAGMVSTQTASQILGYPTGEVEQAKIDHAERLTRIAISQTSISSARGIPDMEGISGEEEKRNSRNTDTDPTTKDKTRGKGKSNE